MRGALFCKTARAFPPPDSPAQTPGEDAESVGGLPLNFLDVIKSFDEGRF